MDCILSIRDLSKVFGRDPEATLQMMRAGIGKEEIFQKSGATIGADHVSFDVTAGETFVIIGLSGSGKSTVVRCLNLLHQPSSGKILFNGRDIVTFSRKELTDYRRHRIAMVFQSFGLFSHRNVLDNVAFGLQIRGMPKKERREKAKEALGLVGLAGQEHQRISALSGGMKQRVGLARALANNPDILLMDEPFSALDPIVRRTMQMELVNLQKKLKKTIVFITHDINEAFMLGDKIAIMRNGKLVQCGTPEDILYRPVDEYVKEFIRDIDKTRALCAWHVMRDPAMPVLRESNLAQVSLCGRSEESEPVFVLDDQSHVCGWLDLKKCDSEGAMTGSLSQLPSVRVDAPLQEVLAIVPFYPLDHPIGVVDAEDVFLGYTTGRHVIAALI